MLRTGICRNPDRDFGVENGEVREDLPQMRVVGLLQLILDNHTTPILVLREKIGTKVPNILLPLCCSEVNPDDVAERVDVLFESRREVVGLVLKHVTGIEAL